jgi:hypothetical protein
MRGLWQKTKHDASPDYAASKYPVGRAVINMLEGRGDAHPANYANPCPERHGAMVGRISARLKLTNPRYQ